MRSSQESLLATNRVELSVLVKSISIFTGLVQISATNDPAPAKRMHYEMGTGNSERRWGVREL